MKSLINCALHLILHTVGIEFLFMLKLRDNTQDMLVIIGFRTLDFPVSTYKYIRVTEIYLQYKFVCCVVGETSSLTLWELHIILN
jgi:hypothetical protein